VPTIKRLEASDSCVGGRTDTSQEIVATIKTAGVEFIAITATGRAWGAELQYDDLNARERSSVPFTMLGWEC
jgi:hypothetical protein